jgi:hypothetical protein
MYHHRPGSKGATWNNTALYSTPFGSSSESTEGVRFDFVKQIPISATTTSIERVSAEEAAEFGMEGKPPPPLGRSSFSFASLSLSER